MAFTFLVREKKPINALITVEHVLKDHPMGHIDVVPQDRWSLATGSITLEFGTFIPGIPGLCFIKDKDVFDFT